MDELQKKIIYLIQCQRSIDDICKELQLSKEELFSLLRKISDSGIPLNVLNGGILTFKSAETIKKPYNIKMGKGHIRLGLIGDTHLASKYDDLDLLNRIYDKAEKRKIDAIFHSGDLVDGIVSVPNYFENLKEETYTGQMKYVIDKYPKYSGKTFAISGNHDDYWTHLTGKEIIKDISKERKDIVYLGPSKRIIYIDGLKINVLHGRFKQEGKVKSVKTLIDIIPEEKRPHFIHLGHYHTSLADTYEGVQFFRTSSLVRESPYNMNRMHINEQSIYWIDVYFDDDGKVDKITHEKDTFSKRR